MEMHLYFPELNRDDNPQSKDLLCRTWLLHSLHSPLEALWVDFLTWLYK